MSAPRRGVALAVAAALLAPAGCAPAPGAPEPVVVSIEEGPAAPEGARALAAAAQPAEDRAPDPPISWERDEPTARERARREGRSLLVYLRADWAPSSLWMEREVWPDPRVRAAGRGFVAIEIDLTSAEGNAELYAHRYGIERVPTVALFDQEGRRVALLAGLARAEALIGAMQAASE